MGAIYDIVSLLYYNEYHRIEIMEEYDSAEMDYGGFFLFEKESCK